MPRLCMTLAFTCTRYIMHKNQSSSSRHPVFRENVLLLLLITIFPLTPPSSCLRSWHTKNCLFLPPRVMSCMWMTSCTLVAVKSLLWQPGATWHRGLWSSRCLIMILLLTPVLPQHILQLLHLTFSTFSAWHAPLFIPFRCSLETSSYHYHFYL